MFFDKHNMNNIVFHIVFIQSFNIPGYGRTQVNTNKCVYGNQGNNLREVSKFVTNYLQSRFFLWRLPFSPCQEYLNRKFLSQLFLTIILSRNLIFIRKLFVFNFHNWYIRSWPISLKFGDPLYQVPSTEDPWLKKEVLRGSTCSVAEGHRKRLN